MDILAKWNCTQRRYFGRTQWHTETKCFCADGRFNVFGDITPPGPDLNVLDKRMSYLCKGSIPGGADITKPLIDVTRTGLTKPGPSDVGYISSYQRDLQAAIAAIVGTRKRGSGLKVTQAEATRLAEESAARSAQTARLRAEATAAKRAKDAAEAERLRALRGSAGKIPAQIQCQRGEKYNINFYQRCDAAYTKKFDFGRNMYYCECAVAETAREGLTPSITPPPTIPPPTIPGGCPRGNRYAPIRFEDCDAGYHPVWEGWFPLLHRYCDCDVAPSGEDEEKGVKDILGALAKGEININSIILAAAVVILIISLIKR